jgi:predicted transposase YdaD
MAFAQLIELVRQFPENGMKLMLQDPANVRDLLALLDADWMNLVDFSRLRLVPTTFVERDFRHVESDVVLVAPLRVATRSRRRLLLIYILIEHQSEPDRLMPLRVLEYVVQVYKHQTRRWSQRHRSFARVQLEPVVPVVFYTGDRRWSSPGRLSDLVALSERFGPVVPLLEPLFLNLGTMAPKGA